jgi:hypothetical protein
MDFQGASSYVQNMWTSVIANYSVIVVFMILVVLFLVVILYILSQLNYNSLKVKRTVYKDVLNVTKSTAPVVVSGADIPTKAVGDAFAFSFWMYLEGHPQTPGFHKMVFYRGEKGGVQAANPIVMMDEISNKMYIVLKTKDSTLTSTDANINYNNLKSIVERNYFLNKNLNFGDMNVNNHIIFEVNNVPFSRWAHFAISVAEDVITIYQDGEIYAVKTVADFVEPRSQDKTIRGELRKYNLKVDDTTGSMFIGKSAEIANNNSVQGYLSKFDVFNHGLALADVQRVYLEGPVHKSWYEKWGLVYGVRSPVFKIPKYVE